MKNFNHLNYYGLFFVSVIFILLSGCTLGSTNDGDSVQATLRAQEIEIAIMKTQQANQNMGGADSQQSAPQEPVLAEPSSTPAPLPTDTPHPTATPLPTQTSLPEITATFTSIPATLQPTATSNGFNPPGQDKGEDKFPIDNKTNDNFSITFICIGGPCAQYTLNKYSFTIPPKTRQIVYLYQGRYRISYSHCGQNYSFDHQINATWRMTVPSCK